MAIITDDDLPVSIQANELIESMVAGANANAARVAPCLVATDPAPTSDQLAEAKLVLIGAISRWAQSGSGAVQSQTLGPYGFTVDTRQKSSGYTLWPTEITQLQDICRGPSDGAGGAFSIDTAPTNAMHAEICAVNFGALYCSCGVDIAGTPIYEYTEDYG